MLWPVIKLQHVVGESVATIGTPFILFILTKLGKVLRYRHLHTIISLLFNAIIVYMDFVYICREGGNNELRYSLRSVFANTPVNNVWVVGGKPGWYTGNYIRIEQNKGSKYLNARANLQAIINSEEIPNKFILMNDDFYITKPIDRIPIYHGGSLADKADRYLNYSAASMHTKKLFETLNLLRENGVRNPLDYSLHVPMTIHKGLLQYSVDMGGAIRSVYGNMNRIGGYRLPVDDVKVHLKTIKHPASFDYLNNEHDLPFVSSSDQTFATMFRPVLKQFTRVSPWERHGKI
jgi:hypothetical protein